MGRLPFELEVREPCRESWDGMVAASGGARHCARCDKEVHDLAGMTGREIERLVLRTRGELCARVTRRADGSKNGSMVMRAERMGAGFGSGFVLAGMLAGAPAMAQSEGKATAKVSGTVVLTTELQKARPLPEREVLFVQDGRAVLKVQTDHDGRFNAAVVPGNYDVVFRSNLLFGERVNGVDFHAGEQEFSPIRERFNLGHLNEGDQSINYATAGAAVMVIGYPLTPKNLFLHPVGVARAVAWQVKWRVRRWLHG